MPNRIIKESICYSDDLDQLTAFEETVFYRLIVACDDFGRMDARPPIVKASCFPLKEKLTLSDVSRALQKLADIGLIVLYEHNGRPYLCLPKWGVHQTIKNQRAKFPPPPEGIHGAHEKPLPSETDVEKALADYFVDNKSAFGYELVSIERQVRFRESYFDIVAKTKEHDFIIELKRNRLSNKAVDQLNRYMEMAGGEGILIGCGLSANFSLERCKSFDIAVISYDDALDFKLVQPSSVVTCCEVTLNHVISQQTKLASNPNPIQSESESKSESESEILREADTAPRSPCIFLLPLVDGTEQEITQDDALGWSQAYPAIDVSQELKKMLSWLNANPKNRKTKAGIKRFCNAWLARAQDKAPRSNGSSAQADSGNQFTRLLEKMQNGEVSL